MKSESSPLKNLVVPAAVLPFLAPMAAFAAEGTGRVSFTASLLMHSLKITLYSTASLIILRDTQAFGIDDGRLIWAALLPSFIIFPLYLQWSSQQESDDFFDGYEKRRQG